MSENTNANPAPANVAEAEELKKKQLLIISMLQWLIARYHALKEKLGLEGLAAKMFDKQISNLQKKANEIMGEVAGGIVETYDKVDETKKEVEATNKKVEENYKLLNKVYDSIIEATKKTIDTVSREDINKDEIEQSINELNRRLAQINAQFKVFSHLSVDQTSNIKDFIARHVFGETILEGEELQDTSNKYAALLKDDKGGYYVVTNTEGGLAREKNDVLLSGKTRLYRVNEKGELESYEHEDPNVTKAFIEKLQYAGNEKDKLAELIPTIVKLSALKDKTPIWRIGNELAFIPEIAFSTQSKSEEIHNILADCEIFAEDINIMNLSEEDFTQKINELNSMIEMTFSDIDEGIYDDRVYKQIELIKNLSSELAFEHSREGDDLLVITSKIGSFKRVLENLEKALDSSNSRDLIEMKEPVSYSHNAISIDYQGGIGFEKNAVISLNNYLNHKGKHDIKDINNMLARTKKLYDLIGQPDKEIEVEKNGEKGITALYDSQNNDFKFYDQDNEILYKFVLSEGKRSIVAYREAKDINDNLEGKEGEKLVEIEVTADGNLSTIINGYGYDPAITNVLKSDIMTAMVQSSCNYKPNDWYNMIIKSAEKINTEQIPKDMQNKRDTYFEQLVQKVGKDYEITKVVDNKNIEIKNTKSDEYFYINFSEKGTVIEGVSFTSDNMRETDIAIRSSDMEGLKYTLEAQSKEGNKNISPSVIVAASRLESTVREIEHDYEKSIEKNIKKEEKEEKEEKSQDISEEEITH